MLLLCSPFNPGPSYQTLVCHLPKNPPTFANSLSICASAPTGSRTCNRSQYKTCPNHHLANSFTSITYPINTHADCKTMNLICQLSVMPFTLEKFVAPFQTVWMDTGSSPQYGTQIYQLPSTHNPTRSLSRNAGLLVSYTNYQNPPQTTSAANLKLHTTSSSKPNTPGLNIR